MEKGELRLRKWWWAALAAVLMLGIGLSAGMWLGWGGKATKSPDGRVTVPPAQTPGTGNPAPATPAAEPKPPGDEEILAFVHKFMQARMAGDMGSIAQMVAPAVDPASIRVTKTGVRITGYSATVASGKGTADTVAVALWAALGTGQPGGEVEVAALQVSWKGQLKVAGYTVSVPDSLALAPGKDGNLYLHSGQSTTTGAVLAALPAVFTPHGAGPGIEFGVGKDGWAVASPSLAGDRIAWCTRGLHPLFGTSRVVFGSAPTVTPLDLMFEAGCVDAAWSPAGEYVALVVAQPSGAVTLHVWDVQAKQRFGPDLQAAVGTVDYTVSNIRWLTGGTVVAFDVQQGGNRSGPWRYDVITKQLTPP